MGKSSASLGLSKSQLYSYSWGRGAGRVPQKLKAENEVSVVHLQAVDEGHIGKEPGQWNVWPFNDGLWLAKIQKKHHLSQVNGHEQGQRQPEEKGWDWPLSAWRVRAVPEPSSVTAGRTTHRVSLAKYSEALNFLPAVAFSLFKQNLKISEPRLTLYPGKGMEPCQCEFWPVRYFHTCCLT